MKRILKFFSPTCGPCKVMSKNLEEVTKVTGVKVIEVDVTDEEDEGNKSLIDEWKPRTIPTVIVIDSKDEVHEFKGIVSAQKIIDILND